MKFAPYTSGRLKQLNIGITSYSEGKTSLNVVGNVGIGTKDPNAAVGAGNTSVLAVGILTANRIYSTVFGQFTGGSVVADNIVGSALSISGIATIGGNVAIGTDDPNAVVGTSNTAILAVGILTANRIYSTVFGEFTGGTVTADNIVGSALSVSGISTLGTVQISSGIITATSGVVTYFGDGSNLIGVAATENVTTNNLKVLGISTFNNSVGINSDLQVTGFSTFTGLAKFSGNFEAVGNVTLGDGTGDNIDVQGRFVRELVPSSNGNKDLGTSSFRWGTLHVKNILQSGGGISTIQQLNVTGQTTLGNVKVTGVSTLGITSATDLEAQQLNVTGVSTFSDNLNLPDNKKIQLGDSSDLQLYHSVSGSGSTSYIDNNTGPLYIRNNVDDDDGGNIIIEAKAGKASAVFQDDEGVRLYYNDAEKIATTGYGVTVNGTTQTQQLNVSGISTLGNTVVGGATTQLLVTGDARVTGEFKVGDGTIILNDAGVSTFPKTVNIGPVSISTVTATTFPFDVQVGGSGDIKLFGGTGIVSATAFYGSGIGLTDISIPGINTSATSNFTNFRVTGVSTLGTVQVSSGIITATSGVVTYFGDGSNLTGTGVGATDSVNTTGIVTASAFSGHGYLQAPYGSTVNFNVTVASKSGHRYQGQGSGQAYVINGVQSPVLTLTPGRTYRFTLSSSDMGSHPFRFYYEADRTTAYTTNVTTTATYAEITVTDTTPNVLHYQCLYHGYMGNSVVTNSNVVDSPYVTTHRKGLNVTSGVSTFAGNINANGNIVGDSATNISGINNVSASTLTGTLQTAAQPNITSLGTLTGLDVNGHSELDNVNVSGISTFGDDVNLHGNAGVTSAFWDKSDGSLKFLDNVEAKFGSDSRLQIYGDSLSGSVIKTTAGGLAEVITAAWSVSDGDGTTKRIEANGIDVDLYFSGSKKFSTTGYGVTVFGTTQTQQLNVTGVSTFAGNINANGNIVGDNATNISGINSVTATSFFGNGQGLTNITADTVGDLASLKVTGLSTFVGNAQFDGNVSIGGTLTYEDVTNVDSIGVITARSGIVVGAGISAVGVITATSFSGDGQDLDKVSIGSTDGNFIGKGYLQAQKTVNAGGDRGNANIILGRFAGCCHDGSSYNVYLGDQAGRKSSSSNTNRNVFIGCQAGCGNTNGYHNVFLGSEAGKGVCGDSGSVNLFAGLQAGIRNTGCYNIAFGKASYGRETGTKNISIGYMAANDVGAGGTSNVFIGDCAGYNAQVNGPPCRGGMSNVYLGTAAGYQNPGDFNIGIGDNSLNGNSSVSAGYRNIALGQCSGNDIQSGVDNIMIGSCSGAKITWGYGNILLGCNSGCCATGMIYNVYAGVNAGKNVCGGGYDIGIGMDNLCDSKWACNNIAIGRDNLRKANACGPSASALFNIAIGDNVGAGLTAGGCNLMFGHLSGSCLTCGSENIILGNRAGFKASASTSNIFIGCYSGRSSGSVACAGQHNIAIGNLAGLGVSATSDRNIFIGYGAGRYSSGGCFNLVLGEHSGSYVTGNRNVFLGQYAGFNQCVTGNQNVVIGDAVCLLSATGSSQLVIGVGATHWIDGDSSYNVTLAGIATAYSATGIVSATKFCGDGSCLTGIDAGFSPDADLNLFSSGTCSGCNLDGSSGCFNLFLGACAGKNVTSGASNVYLGDYAGSCMCNGSDNIAIGSQALLGSGTVSNNSGIVNIAIGKEAGKSITTGGCNIIVGCKAAFGITTGAWNTIFGTAAGRCLTTQNFNAYFGTDAGKRMRGAYNTAFGANAMEGSSTASNNTGGCNIAIGKGAGEGLTTGDNNIFMGKCAGECNTSGATNIFLGTCAGKDTTIGSFNFFGGYKAAEGNIGGACNVYIGNQVGYAATGGEQNIALGQKSAYNNSTGSYNISFGTCASYSLTSGSQNIVLGKLAMDCAAVTGSNNIALGANSSKCMTSGNNNIALGAMSLQCCMSTGCYNVAIGAAAGRKLQNNCNIAIGFCALFGNGGGIGYCNIAIGLNAGRKLTNGHANIFMGTCAGQNITGSGSADGSYNIGFGHGALGATASGGATSGNFNAVMGHYSGIKISSGSSNTLMGRVSGCSISSGGNNTFLGSGSGKCVSTGSKNIAIGKDATPPSNTSNCQLVIGIESYSWMVGNSDFNVGIGTTNPNAPVGAGNTAKLSVGIVSAYQLYGDGSALTGISAGFSPDDDQNLFASNTCAGMVLDGTSGCFNLLLGCNAGRCVTSGAENVYLGRDAGRFSNTGGRNVAIGYHAGCCACTNAAYNVNIGNLAGAKLVSQCCSVNIGQCAGYSDFPGNSNVFIGSCAGWRGGCGGKNIAIGNAAGLNMKGTCKAVFLGDYAGRCIQGASNIAIGECALLGSSAPDSNTAGFNIALGHKAGRNILTGEKNVILGTSAGHNMTSGSHNVLLGTSAGVNNSSGLRNIVIGCNVQLVATGNDQFAVGCGTCRWIEGDSSFNVTLAGIATAYSATGIVSATKFCGDGSCLTGISAGFTPDNQENLYAGTNTGAASDADTCHNVAIGYEALKVNCAGDRNVALGDYAGKSNLSGCDNIFLGSCAGCSLTNPTQTIAIGNFAAREQTSSSYNIFLGDSAGRCNFNGNFNLVLGYQAQGCACAALAAAGCNSDNNVIIGYQVARATGSGCGNVLIGCGVGIGITDANNQNVMIGQNIACGASTGRIGGYNTFVGDTIAKCLTTGQNNAVFGRFTGHCLSSGAYNSLFGRGAGQLLATGSSNTFIGRYAGCAITSGSNNVVIGICAGCNKLSATGNEQIAIGAGNRVHLFGESGTGFGNIETTIAGIATVYSATGIVSATKYCGDGSCLTGLPGFTQDSNCNLIAGFSAGTCAGASPSSFNIIMGCGTGCFNGNGSHNVVLGTHSGKCAVGATRNVLIGMCAGTCVNNGKCNVYIGNYSGANQYCSDNIAIGCKALCGSTTASNNTGNNNVALGRNAGANVTSGCKNILLGCDTGKCITTGYCNVFIGSLAGVGDAAITGYRNTVVGDCAGVGIEGGYLNAIFGHGAGNSIENDIGNTLIGACAGRDIRYNDNYNTFIGFRAGRLQQGGCGNVIIGACIDRVPFYCDTGGSANEGCQLIIGYESNVWLSGNKDWNVGIGTTNTKTELQVGSHYGVSSGMGTFTAAAGVAHTINQYTISSTDFKTAEYTIFAGIGSDIQSQKLLVMQDGTTAYSQEYAVMSSDTLLVSASATLASGVVKVEITPETGVSGLTTFRFTRHTML